MLYHAGPIIGAGPWTNPAVRVIKQPITMEPSLRFASAVPTIKRYLERVHCVPRDVYKTLGVFPYKSLSYSIRYRVVLFADSTYQQTTSRTEDKSRIEP